MVTNFVLGVFGNDPLDTDGDGLTNNTGADRQYRFFIDAWNDVDRSGMNWRD